MSGSEIAVSAITGFISGLAASSLASYLDHRNSRIRDEWAAGTELRRLLNLQIETHRRSLDAGTEGSIEFVRLVTNRRNGNDSVLTKTGDAIHEFKDFLSGDDQLSLESHWGEYRKRVLAADEAIATKIDPGRSVEDMFNGHQLIEENAKGFGSLLAGIKHFTLKQRNESFWEYAMRRLSLIFRTRQPS